ncbi:NAD+ synthase [candidate division WOR-3 bacterium]|nr:NAD+ synthase [candidate division WOR-3 bacterium]
MNLPDKISEWIKAKVDEAGAKGIVLGLSGGLDSAVVGVLAKQSLGKNVLGIIMPCHNEQDCEEDANLIATKFKIKTARVVLDKIFDELLNVLPDASNLTQANLKPRLRMLILYYFANKLNYLVAGTGNKSELTVGYFTKYGDGGVDILPLGRLLKTQVIELAKELKIPQKIIEKAPSADLWKGQTDEGELGISYAELDKTILAIESGNPETTDPMVLNKLLNLMQASEHKRLPVPFLKT